MLLLDCQLGFAYTRDVPLLCLRSESAPVLRLGPGRNSLFLSYTPFWCRQTRPVAEAARRLEAAGRAREPGRRQILGLVGDEQCDALCFPRPFSHISAKAPHPKRLKVGRRTRYRFVGPAFSKGMYGAWPRHDPATALVGAAQHSPPHVTRPFLRVARH